MARLINPKTQIPKPKSQRARFPGRWALVVGSFITSLIGLEAETHTRGDSAHGVSRGRESELRRADCGVEAGVRDPIEHVGGVDRPGQRISVLELETARGAG